MIDLNTSVQSSDDSDLVKKLEKAFKELTDKKVLIGIPKEANSQHDGGGLTNAELLYIHENGAPANNIPARPTLEPSINREKEHLGEMLGDIVKNTIDGDTNVKEQLERVGLEAQNIVKDWFINADNGYVPDKPETIKRKGSSNPLIDTGQLRNSITYVVKEGRNND